MKKVLIVVCSTAVALLVLDTVQVTKTSAGLTLGHGGQVLAADFPVKAPPPPPAPVGKGKAPIGKGKGKGPVVTRG